MVCWPLYQPDGKQLRARIKMMMVMAQGTNLKDFRTSNSNN